MNEKLKNLMRNRKLQWAGIFLLILLCFGIGVKAASSLGYQNPENPMEEREANPSRLILSDGEILLNTDKISDLISTNTISGGESEKQTESEDSEGTSENTTQTQEQLIEEQTQEELTLPETTPLELQDIEQLLSVTENIQKIEDLGILPEEGGSQWESRFESIELPSDTGVTGGTGGDIIGDLEGGDTPIIGGDEEGDASLTELLLYTDLNSGVTANQDVTFTAFGTYGTEKIQAEVVLNGSAVTGNGEEFSITLNEGENVVMIIVKYGQESKTATFMITYDPEELFLITNLVGGDVWEQNLTITAYGKCADNILAATVSLNGTYVNGSGDQFELKFKAGENIVEISTANDKDYKEQTFVVYYHETQFYVATTISDTILYGTEASDANETVTIPQADLEYVFDVYVANVGDGKLLEVRNYDYGNGHVLGRESDGYYHVTLNARTRSKIQIKYRDADGAEHRYIYYLNYQRTFTPPEKYPILDVMVEVEDTRINLVNGMEFRSPYVMLDINTTSYRGEQLYYNHETVVFNGYKYPQHDYQTGTWFGYELYLQEGENILQITVEDDDQYAVVYTYILYYTPGDITVTISVEAGTVGIPYLVEPTKVTVPGGTNVTYIVIELLNELGYKPTGNGDLDVGFYLSGIEQAGLLDRAKIPDDLLERLAMDGIEVRNMTGDWLGEFDYTYYSGWMYSVNGHYPGYSMSKCRPQDGAIIRIRYTLAYGKDIGGYVAQAAYPCGTSSTNYEKEW